MEKQEETTKYILKSLEKILSDKETIMKKVNIQKDLEKHSLLNSC